MLNSPLSEPSPRSRLLPRFLAFGAVCVLVVGTLSARLVYLQVSRGADDPRPAPVSRVAVQPIVSARGLITDRSGTPLVTNRPSFAVRVIPADLPFSRRVAVLARLATLLHTTPDALNQLLDRTTGSTFDAVRIASDIDQPTARVISEEHEDLPGVEIFVDARREYPLGPLVSQIVGYTGAVTSAELDALTNAGYQNDDVIGKAGVESAYEAQLRGTYGSEQVERDASGRVVRTIAQVAAPEAGGSLQLSIDLKTQKDAEKALRWAMDLAGLKRGVVAVMNPQTGEILALVSLPTYDNNLFAEGISRADYAKLATDPNQPLLNHAISEQYAPGSTYKLVTGTGALADHRISTSTTLESKPFISIGPYKYFEWNKRGFKPTDGKPCCDIFDGFGHSSDVFFYQLAGMLGIDRLAYWAKAFGFGARTGIDLPGEAHGTVPSNAWKQEVFGQSIFPGETYQAGIGQGYDTATPIQLLDAYAALANGGRLLQPQVVRQIVAADGTVVQPFAPKLIRQLPASADVLKTMREAARRVLTIRHTYNFVDLPLVVAGKSGTAEFGKRDAQGRLPFHSWFAGFVPKSGDVDKPDSELAIAVFAYDSRTRGNVATEIAKYFMQIHYDLRDKDGNPVDLRNFQLLQRDNFYEAP